MKPTGRKLRTLAVYIAAGAAITYVVTFVSVRFLPIPSMAYSCTTRVVKCTFDGETGYMRLREWTAPYGSTFQIHPTSQRGAATQNVAVEPVSDSGDPIEMRRRDASIPREPLHPPRWSYLYDEWPQSCCQNYWPIQYGRYWYEVRGGWPMPCLYGRYIVLENRAGTQVVESTAAIPLKRQVATSGPWSSVYEDVVLPLQPVFPMFAVNAASYGLLAFALVRGPRWFIARRRKRRGACGVCGYDLRGSAARCPECGTQFGRRVQAGDGPQENAAS